MEFKYSPSGIKMDRELKPLDHFVIEFCSKLNEAGIKYAIVSGYVAIAFGRSRETEDIDIIVEKLSFDKFAELWKKLSYLECINASSDKDAYENYLLQNSGIRFSEPGKPIPNFEFKFTKTFIDQYTVENALELQLNGHKLNISPLELQIAYKLLLGSEKDEEDAVHLYETFKEKIDKAKLSNFVVLLKVERKKVKLLEGK